MASRCSRSSARGCAPAFPATRATWTSPLPIRRRVRLMVCSTAPTNLAARRRRPWGIPYFEGSFYGVSDTSEALRQLARLPAREGADRRLVDRTEILIAKEEARVWSRLQPYRQAALRQARAAQHRRREVVVGRGGADGDRRRDRLDLDQEIDRRGQGAHQGVAQGREARLRRDGATRPSTRCSPAARPTSRSSGGRTQFIALKAKTPWLDINQERAHPYAGYDGMVELVRQIDLAIHNPIRAEVRAPAPWDMPARGEAGSLRRPRDFVAQSKKKFAATTADDMGSADAREPSPCRFAAVPLPLRGPEGGASLLPLAGEGGPRRAG